MKKIILTAASLLIVGMANATHYLAYGCSGGKYFMCDVDNGQVHNIHTFGPCSGSWAVCGKIVANGDLPSGVNTDAGAENMLNSLSFANSELVTNADEVGNITTEVNDPGTLKSVYINADNIVEPAMRSFLLGN